MALPSLNSSSIPATDLPTIKFNIPTLTIIEDFDKLIAKEVIFDETGKFKYSLNLIKIRAFFNDYQTYDVGRIFFDRIFNLFIWRCRGIFFMYSLPIFLSHFFLYIWES
jgi:hypothetical protein